MCGHIACSFVHKEEKNAMTGREDQMKDWLTRIQGEYKEMPGLHLTKPQMRRLWGLDATACDALLERLQSARFLRVTADGCYALVDDAA
jgi:hypothetical protein